MKNNTSVVHTLPQHQIDKEKLSLYNVSNLRKLDRLIFFCIDYLQIKGIHLGDSKKLNVIILPNKKLRSRGIEIFEISGFIDVLNDLNNDVFLTLPLEKKFLKNKAANIHPAELPESRREQHEREFNEFMAKANELSSVDDLRKNTIIEYHAFDVYKILTGVQVAIKNILPAKVDNKNNKTAEVKKIIFISETKGIYRQLNEKDKLTYAIKGVKRKQYIKNLRDKPQVPARLLNPNYQLLSKEITKINKLFRTNLNLNYDLIVPVPTGGYTLDTTKYDIKFID